MTKSRVARFRHGKSPLKFFSNGTGMLGREDSLLKIEKQVVFNDVRNYFFS